MATLIAIVAIIVLIAIIAGIYFLLDWAITKVALGEPFTRILNIVLVVGVVVALLLIVLPKVLALVGVSLG